MSDEPIDDEGAESKSDGMFDFEVNLLADASSETTGKAKKYFQYRLINKRMTARFEQMGYEFNLAIARSEFIMAKMCELGIMTVDQYIEISMAWEKGLRVQLGNYQTIIADREAARREQLKRPSPIVRADGSPANQQGLYLPNSARD